MSDNKDTYFNIENKQSRPAEAISLSKSDTSMSVRVFSQILDTETHVSWNQLVKIRYFVHALSTRDNPFKVNTCVSDHYVCNTNTHTCVRNKSIYL